METKSTIESAVLVEKHDHSIKIVLNHPSTLNSFVKDLVTGLRDSLDIARRDESVRAVLITGTGRGFCSGGNLNELVNLDGAAAGREYVAGIHEIIQQIVDLPKIVITAVNGMAVGAGCSLALAGDIIIVSEDAKFSLPFLNVGLVPDCGASYFLPRIVGTARAKELMLTGRSFSACEAWEMGMVSRVVPAGDFTETVEHTLQTIASGPSQALGLTKLNINAGQDQGLKQLLDAEAYAQGICLQTEDHKIAVSAFKEKRKPQFVGR